MAWLAKIFQEYPAPTIRLIAHDRQVVLETKKIGLE